MDIAICDDCFNDIQRLEELILQHRKEQENTPQKVKGIACFVNMQPMLCHTADDKKAG